MDPSTTEPTPTRKNRGRFSSAAWLVALAVVLALHVWFPHVDPGVNDTYSVDVGGRNALYQFAERSAPFTSRNHDSLVGILDWLYDDATLCLLGPARYPTPREWTAIVDWVNSGGRLVLAARWDDAGLTIPGVGAKVTSTGKKVETILEQIRSQSESPKKSKSKPGAKPPTETAKPGDPATPASPPPVVAGPIWTSLLSTADITWKTEGAIEAPGAEVLVKTGDSAQAVRIHHGAGTIVLVASDYIFSNAAIFEPGRRNGMLAVKLLEAAGPTEELLFDESLNATGTPKVVGVLLDPLLRPATLQVVVLLVIFGWLGNRRFGGLLPSSAPARHDVADHTNSLGNLYYKAHHGTGVLREYLEQLRTELRLRYTGSHEQRVLVPLAQKANMSLDDLQRLLSDADAAARKPKLSRKEAASVIRRLAHLRQAAHSK